MDKSIIAYKIEIDYTKDTITLKEQGRTGYIEKLYQVTPYNAASACRSAAYQLLERAFYIEHSKDTFKPCVFSKESLNEQAGKMISENTLSIFETA